MQSTAQKQAAAPARPGPRPNAGVRPAYSTDPPTGSRAAPIDLWLAGNEGRSPAGYSALAKADELARYPSTADLSRSIAKKHDVEPRQVLVTAGADDALLRLALAYLDQGREIVLPSPTFVMIERYAELAGGTVVRVDWPAGTEYPTESVLKAIGPRTSLVAMVSPNNPTGDVASQDDLERVAAAAPSSLVVVDCAYAEFADEDLTDPALELPNAVVLRTFSKAYGCAGLRVGYALGSPEVIEVLRAAGNPYPCAGPSLAAADGLLDGDIAPFVETVRTERDQLAEALNQGGMTAFPSQGNFVYAQGPRAGLVAVLLTGFGIAVRSFPAPLGTPAIRITCPGKPALQERLLHALATVLQPEAILFDMDGVLADVSRSYREAILRTAADFGVNAQAKDIEALKAAGSANDDWALTQRLLQAAGVDVPLDEVTARFEEIYQGAGGAPGLKATEALLLPRETLAILAGRFRLGIVTGRPSSDAQFFLGEQGIADLFDTVVTREDAALKPSPDPTRLALRNLGVQRAWLLGDTVDDIRSAQLAGVLGIGVLAPGAQDKSAARNLRSSGAATVLTDVNELMELLP